MGFKFVKRSSKYIILVAVAVLTAAAPVIFAEPAGERLPRLLTLNEAVDAQALADQLEALPEAQRPLAAVKAEGLRVAEALSRIVAGRGADETLLWAGRGLLVSLSDQELAPILQAYPSVQAETLTGELRAVEPETTALPPEAGRRADGRADIVLPWNHGLSGASALAKERNLSGKGVVIGVVGPDLPLFHPCLADHITFSKQFGSSGGPAPAGTTSVEELMLLHPLGVLAGTDPRKFRGIAPQVELALATIPKGKIALNHFLTALQWALEPNPGVKPAAILFCLDFQAPAPRVVRDMLIACRNAGILPIVPAGNIPSRITGMAALPEVVTIGAIDSWKARASFSGMGPVVVDQVTLTKPDFMEPGLSILGPSHDVATYRFGSGTLQAAAHFAGIWAMMRECHPDDTLDVALGALATTSIDLGAYGADNAMGMGLPDPSAALYIIENPPPPPEDSPIP